MTTSPRGERDPGRTSMVAYGLLFGPALGMLVALVLGADAIALGLVLGAAAGVVVGAVLDARH